MPQPLGRPSIYPEPPLPRREPPALPSLPPSKSSPQNVALHDRPLPPAHLGYSNESGRGFGGPSPDALARQPVPVSPNPTAPGARSVFALQVAETRGSSQRDPTSMSRAEFRTWSGVELPEPVRRRAEAELESFTIPMDHLSTGWKSYCAAATDASESGREWAKHKAERLRHAASELVRYLEGTLAELGVSPRPIKGATGRVEDHALALRDYLSFARALAAGNEVSPPFVERIDAEIARWDPAPEAVKAEKQRARAEVARASRP